MCPKVHLETVRKHYDSPTLFNARNLRQILISQFCFGILNPHYNCVVGWDEGSVMELISFWSPEASHGTVQVSTYSWELYWKKWEPWNLTHSSNAIHSLMNHRSCTKTHLKAGHSWDIWLVSPTLCCECLEGPGYK